jgi:hypothetical protein
MIMRKSEAGRKFATRGERFAFIIQVILSQALK